MSPNCLSQKWGPVQQGSTVAFLEQSHRLRKLDPDGARDTAEFEVVFLDELFFDQVSDQAVHKLVESHHHEEFIRVVDDLKEFVVRDATHDCSA